MLQPWDCHGSPVQAPGGIIKQAPGKALCISEPNKHVTLMAAIEAMVAISFGHWTVGQVTQLLLCQKHQQDLRLDQIGSSWFLDTVRELDGILSS